MSHYPKIVFNSSTDYESAELQVTQMYACVVNMKRSSSISRLIDDVNVIRRALGINKEKGNTVRYEANVKDAYNLLWPYADCYTGETPSPTELVLNLVDGMFIPYLRVSVDGGSVIPAVTTGISFFNTLEISFDSALDPNGEAFAELVLFNGSSYKWADFDSPTLLLTPSDSVFLSSAVDIVNNIPYPSGKEVTLSVGILVNGSDFTVRINDDPILDVNNPSVPVVALPKRAYENAITFALAYSDPFTATMILDGQEYVLEGISTGGTYVVRKYFLWRSNFNITSLIITTP